MATKVRGVKATLVLASCSGTATPVTLHHIFVQLRKMSPKERQSITLPLFHCVAAGITDRPCVKRRDDSDGGAPQIYSSMLLRSNTLSVLERYSRRLNGNVDSIGYGVTLIDKLRYEEYHMTILHDPTFIQGHRKEMLTGTAGSQRTDLMAGIIRTRVTTIHVADNIIMRVEIVIPFIPLFS